MVEIEAIAEERFTPAENLPGMIGQEVTLAGCIYKVRRMSGFAFVILQTRRQLVQCVYLPELTGFGLEAVLEGAWVVMEGIVAADERSVAGYEIQLTSMKHLSASSGEYPVTINNKTLEAGLDTILDYRPLTLRHEKERAAFRLQEGLARGFREFLQAQQFTEIHSPKIVFAGAEGGANIFKLDYFGKQVHLAQSPQFYKQAMVGVYHRVFEIGPVFRAEKHDTSRHINEYTSLDMEMGFIDGFEDVMRMETAMLRYTMRLLAEEYQREIDLLNISVPEILAIPSIKFSEAKELILINSKRVYHDMFDFEPWEEQWLGEYFWKEHNSAFVFITHYPTEKRPFYAMNDTCDSSLTLSFDLLFHGLEVTTGGQRIHDYSAQLEKLKRVGMDILEFESYLMPHLYGLPPHGGLGIGLERMTAKMLRQDNVRRGSLFPRDKSRVTP